MTATGSILLMILGIVKTFIIIHFIMSWLISFQVLNVRQDFVARVWYSLQALMEPIYRPIRRVLPNLGGIDLSPLVAYIAVTALQIIVQANL